jgi:hypothetical protein
LQGCCSVARGRAGVTGWDLAIAARDCRTRRAAAVKAAVRAQEDRRDSAPIGLPQVQGSASGAGALIEVEVRDIFGFGRVVCGRLVEVEAGIGIEGKVVLRRSARGGEGRRGGGQAEVLEDGVRGFCGGDEGEDAHVGAAAGAGEGEDLVDAGEEASPAGAGGGALWGVRQVGVCRGRAGPGRQLIGCGAGHLTRHFGVVAAEIDDLLAQARVRCEDAVVAVAVDAGRWDQAAECGRETGA